MKLFLFQETDRVFCEEDKLITTVTKDIPIFHYATNDTILLLKRPTIVVTTLYEVMKDMVW